MLSSPTFEEHALHPLTCWGLYSTTVFNIPNLRRAAGRGVVDEVIVVEHSMRTSMRVQRATGLPNISGSICMDIIWRKATMSRKSSTWRHKYALRVGMNMLGLPRLLCPHKRTECGLQDYAVFSSWLYKHSPPHIVGVIHIVRIFPCHSISLWTHRDR